MAWDELIPQAELTLNLMRSSGITPYMSAWHQLHGAYSYNRTPIAPPGMRVVVHEKPDKRPSWGYHGLDGFYVGPALGGSYRCFTVFITDTLRTRVTNTLSWHPPAGSQLPGTSPTDDLVSLLAQVETAITTLTNCPTLPADQQQLLLAAQPNVTLAFSQFRRVFSPPTTSDLPSAGIERVHQPPEPLGPPPGLTMPPATFPFEIPAPSDKLPFTVPVAVNPVSTTADQQRVSADEQRVPHEGDPTSGEWNRVSRRRQKKKNTPQITRTKSPRAALTVTSAPPPVAPDSSSVANPASPSITKIGRRRNRQNALPSVAAHPLPPPSRTASLFGRSRRKSVMPSRFRAMAAIAAANFSRPDNFAGSAIHVGGSAPVAPLTYRAAKKGPNRLRWVKAESEEFTRLLEDYGGVGNWCKLHPVVCNY
jgi:hypothetical protein